MAALKLSPTKRKLADAMARKMWSTTQFFTVPGACEKLIRDEGELYRFTQSVLVFRIDEEAVDEYQRRVDQAALSAYVPGQPVNWANVAAAVR